MEALRPVDQFREQLEERVLSPLTRTGRGYYLLVGALLLIMAWGLFAYIYQWREGLYVTAMRDHSLWGLYISLFVFFIGISHAGTLISAILRVSKAGWRVPTTRMAEFITVVALMIGAFFPLIDLGRPDRVHHLILFGRWQSPLIWDVIAISTYLTGSFIYLYLPLIPDLAIARDRISHRVSPVMRWFFKTFSLGWRDSPTQKRRLTIALGMMMVMIIPVAVSVHTVVSWIFSMTMREPWDNPMFGAFFVAGAIYSGIGTIIIVMAIIRKAYHLEDYITSKQFINLGYMLGGFALIMMYFNVLEFVTIGYKLAGENEHHFQVLFTGDLAPYFWFYSIGGMIIPGLIVLFPWTRTILGIVIASILVDIGMWAERYFIVVGGSTLPTMPYEAAWYFPTWVEWSIMLAAFAAFTLIITIFIKVVPVISIWEVVEHHEEQIAGVPDESPAPAVQPVPNPESMRLEGERS
ncbi:MAG: polysulfide reductase NrfD [SAR202 cluster bacterium]|nr:polysulfide reductase NrfD [SAR202 cluster bacterium]